MENRRLISGGLSRTYTLYVPDRARAAGPSPMLLLLHGSGGRGRGMVGKWRRQADRHGIILVGPDSTDPEFWNLNDDGPAFLHDVVETVRREAAVDGRRMFLFGHSAGAVFGLEIASLESEYFAAVATHAGSVDIQNQVIFDYARRKIPVFLIVGTNDPFFSVQDIRSTRDALRRRNFPVRTWEIGGHNHVYYGQGINKRAWEFLAPYALPAEPKYTEYAPR